MTRAERVFEALEAQELSAVQMDGFDAALIGYVVDGDDGWARLVYSYDRCLRVLMKQMSANDAVEYFDFNVAGSLVANAHDGISDMPLVLHVD